MTEPRRLRFEEVAPGRTFHAALVEPVAVRQGERHTHDFLEVMVVLKGAGRHLVNGSEQRLDAGTILLVRPPDLHTIRAARAEELFFVNVAFPVEVWDAMVGPIGLERAWSSWTTAPEPPLHRISPSDRQACEAASMRAVTDYHHGGDTLHLARFLTSVLPHLLEREEGPALNLHGPQWLELALTAMYRTENLSAGLPRLIELAGVSLPHLCRTMKAKVGKTPTEYINDLRIQNAATLLTTTRMEIREIVAECGMENVSHFYRQFRRRYATSPMEYRRREAQRLA